MTPVPERLPEPILVVGGYGYRNLGDEAMLAGLLSLLAPREVTVVSRRPRETSAVHGVRSVGLAGAVTALWQHRTVLIGGGGIFGPDMGRIGSLLPGFGLLARGLGRQVVITGVDVEASTHPGRLSRRLFRSAAWLAVRDPESVTTLAGWGIRSSLAPDLSTWMEPDTTDAGRRLLADAGIDPGRPVVGLMLTDLRPALGEAVLEAVAVAMEALPEVQFCFIPFSRHPYRPAHDDAALARRLQHRQPRLAVVEDAHRPQTLLAAMAHVSAVMAMRYHAVLFALRQDLPLVAIPYADKVDRLLRQHAVSPVRPDADAVLAALRQALAERVPGRVPELKAS